MDRGACWTTVHGVTKSRTWLSTFNHKCVCVNPHLPIFPSPLLLPSEHKFVFYVCNSISVRSIGSFVPFFTVLHLSDIIWYLSFSLFLHSVWQALGPSTLLQTADKAKKERNYLFLERGFCLSLIRNKKVIFIGLMLKLKLKYCDLLMQRTNSLEKTLMLGKTEGGRRRGQ